LGTLFKPIESAPHFATIPEFNERFEPNTELPLDPYSRIERAVFIAGKLYQICIEAWQVTHRLPPFLGNYLLSNLSFRRAVTGCDKREQNTAGGPPARRRIFIPPPKSLSIGLLS
jgi:hypothetical protein